MWFSILAFIPCFLGLWLGSGLVISSVTDLAKRYTMPIFTVSFFVLGLLTSLPEMTIGLLATLDNDPDIYVGNLLGGTIIIFFLIIPCLGLLGNGITLPREFPRIKLLVTLMAVSTPFVFIANNVIEIWESIVMVLTYTSLPVLFNVSWPSRFHKKTSYPDRYGIWPLSKIALGIVLMAVASKQIISSTLFLADLFETSPFFVSLVVVSFGTNLPEFSIIFRALFLKKTEVALADYLGSASANTLLLGVLSLIRWEDLRVTGGFAYQLPLTLIGMLGFFLFAQSKHKISRIESALLVCCYVAFLVTELCCFA